MIVTTLCFPSWRNCTRESAIRKVNVRSEHPSHRIEGVPTPPSRAARRRRLVVVLGGEVLELATGVADPDDEGRERENPARDDEDQRRRDADEQRRHADRQQQRLKARPWEVDLLADGRRAASLGLAHDT